MSSRHHQTRTLDYGYLLGLLEDVHAHWDEAASLPQEQVVPARGLETRFCRVCRVPGGTTGGERRGTRLGKVPGVQVGCASAPPAAEGVALRACRSDGRRC